MYVNWGRLVADCEKCSDAQTVEPGRRMMRCVAGHDTELEFDEALPQVMAVLGERAEESRRNWFPRGHSLAVKTGQPHGQSITELRDEHAAAIAGGN